MDISLKVSNVGKSFSSVLFKDVSIGVYEPKKIALIGENGSGKSTFLKMLTGQETSPEGTIVWGKDVEIGYLEQELSQELEGASGGEKKLIKLSQLFYGNYNVILLDEPDNHLDVENKIWFEDLVRDFEGLVITISHDRSFLKNAVDEIWLLEEGKIIQFPFGYEKFGEVYGDSMSSRKHLWETQEKERKRLKELVDLFRIRAASNTKMAKTYSGMIKRYDRFVETMVEKPPAVKNISLGIHLEKQPAKKTAIHLKDLNKSYGKNHVLKDLNLHLFCGDKVAINAPNGSGKSTLLNILSGRLKEDSGEIYFGPGLKIGCYTQEHLSSLDEEATLVVELQKSVHLHHYDAIGYLKRFLFTENQINSQVHLLSGGQKSRLQLAKFLGTNPDILILDEPTNHLDLKTVLALEKFLVDYKGTLVLVSHDRSMVERVVDKIYNLQDGKLLEGQESTQNDKI